MLWLNSITLFFHNLSNKSQESAGSYDVAVWAKDIHNAQRPATKSKGTHPSRSNSSSATLISKRSALTSGPVVARAVNGDEDEATGLSDRDERFGAERDDAASSPVKPVKVRAASTVSLRLSNDVKSSSFDTVPHFHQIRTPCEPTKEQRLAAAGIQRWGMAWNLSSNSLSMGGYYWRSV